MTNQIDTSADAVNARANHLTFCGGGISQDADLLRALSSRIRGEVIEAAKAKVMDHLPGSYYLSAKTKTLAAIDALHTPESRAAVKGGKP